MPLFMEKIYNNDKMAVVFTKDGLATFTEEWRILAPSSLAVSGLHTSTYENNM